MKYLIALSLLMTTPIFAQDQQDITEGKIQAAEADMVKDLYKQVEQKQQKAYALVAMVAEVSHERYSVGNDSRREEAEYAHVGFVARLQGIREDREALERKEIQPDLIALQNYSKRLDSLIADMQAFLK